MLREIVYTVSENTKTVEPSAKQWAGIQYEDNATVVKFDLSSVIAKLPRGTKLYKINFNSSAAGFDPSENLTINNNILERKIGKKMTQYGGEITITAEITIADSNNNPTGEIYSYPVTVFFSKQERDPSSSGEVIANISTAEVVAKQSANEAKGYSNDSKSYNEQAKGYSETAKTHFDNTIIQANNALKSSQNAKTSETNAKTSETNAKTSENNAKASENRAKTSETNAKTSENNAKASENRAKTSETNAKTSENNALSFQVNARTYSIASERYRDEAKVYSETALESKNDAKQSENNAKIYAEQSKTTFANIQEAIKNKAEQSDLNNLRNLHFETFNDLDNRKADKSYVDETFATKQNVEQNFSIVNGRLGTVEQDISEVNGRCNTIELDVANKVERTTLNAELKSKADKAELSNYMTNAQFFEQRNFILDVTVPKTEFEKTVGDIETALDSIIALQESLMGGDSE